MRVRYPITQTDSGVVAPDGTLPMEEEGELITISIGTVAPGQMAAFAFVKTDAGKLSMVLAELISFV